MYRNTCTASSCSQCGDAVSALIGQVTLPTCISQTAQYNNLYTQPSRSSTLILINTHTHTAIHCPTHYSVSLLISRVICKTDYEENTLYFLLPLTVPPSLACGGPVVLHRLSEMNGDNGSHMPAVGFRQAYMKHLFT